jgi:hypothetical protein
MFLDIPSMDLKELYKRNTSDEELVTLEDCMFPPDIKQHIAVVYHDLQDPMKQKLVEPFCIAFGGKKNEGVPDFSRVNWEEVKDYFSFEYQSINQHREEAERLQEEAFKKHGHIFNHYQAYEGGISYNF